MKSMRAEVEEMKRLRAEGKLWPTVKPGYLPPRDVEETLVPEPGLRFEDFITEREEMSENDKDETEQPKKRRGCPPGGWPKKNKPQEEKPSKRKYTRRRTKASSTKTGDGWDACINDAKALLEEKRREYHALKEVVEQLEARRGQS